MTLYKEINHVNLNLLSKAAEFQRRNKKNQHWEYIGPEIGYYVFSEKWTSSKSISYIEVL